MDSYTMTPADMRAVTDGARDDGFGMGGGWVAFLPKEKTFHWRISFK